MKESKAMFDLEKHNTFKMKVKAKNGLFINTAEDLNKVDTDKYLILGSGSDVLFVDDYVDTPAMRGRMRREDDEDDFNSHILDDDD